MEALNRMRPSYLSLDRIVDEETNGEYVEPFGEHGVGYKFRELFRYCEVHGKRLEDLTDEELKPFEFPIQGSGIKHRSDR